MRGEAHGSGCAPPLSLGPGQAASARKAPRPDSKKALAKLAYEDGGAARQNKGYDAGKKTVGRKRHIAVDSDGRLLMVHLTPADISDSAGAQVILDGIRKRWSWVKHLFADGAYDRLKLMDKAAHLDFVITVIRRSDDHARLDLSEAMILVVMGGNRRRTLGPYRTGPRRLHPTGMHQLLPPRWLCVNLSVECSSGLIGHRSLG